MTNLEWRVAQLEKKVKLLLALLEEQHHVHKI